MAELSFECNSILEILGRREIEKLQKLAMACGEELDKNFLKRALSNTIKIVPNSISEAHFVPLEIQDSIEKIERSGSKILIVLKDGTTLRTFPSRQQYRNYYYCFRHMLRTDISPESYQACHDITNRYNIADVRIRLLKKVGLVQNSVNLNIIECGAYNGWKALGFAKHIGRGGKIIVLEIDDEQYELAKFNLENNLDRNQFQVIHTGVWNQVEERTYSYEHYASHSLNVPDEHRHHTQEKVIKTDTLDNIIDRSGVDTFDFLNVQTGGSELESVQGLQRNLNRVKLLWLGTHYVHQNVSTRYRTIEYLLDQGCRIYDEKAANSSLSAETPKICEIKSENLDPEKTGGFFAVSPKFKDEIIPNCLV